MRLPEQACVNVAAARSSTARVERRTDGHAALATLSAVLRAPAQGPAVDVDLPVFPPMGDWVDRAVCGALDAAEVFTAARKPEPGELALLERVCQRCPVRQDCRDYAAEAPVYGFWGGTWHSGRVARDEAA